MRCTSGLFASIECAICFMTVVLPALGGDTIMPALTLADRREQVDDARREVVLVAGHLEVELRVREQRREVLEPWAVARLLGVEPRHRVDAQQRRVLLVVRGRPARTFDVVAPAQREPPRLADRDVDVLGRGQVPLAAQEAVALVAQVEQALHLDELAGVGLVLAAALQLAPAGHGHGHAGAGCDGCPTSPSWSPWLPRFWLFWLLWFSGCGCPAAGSAPWPCPFWRGEGRRRRRARAARRRQPVRRGRSPPASRRWRWPARRPAAGASLPASAAGGARGRPTRPVLGAGGGVARCGRDGFAPLPRVAVGPPADPEVTPVASRIWSMMSAFFVRLVVLSDMAWAMALSSSRSLPSRTERSSCCSAVIGLLLEGRRRLG